MKFVVMATCTTTRQHKVNNIGHSLKRNDYHHYYYHILHFVLCCWWVTVVKCSFCCIEFKQWKANTVLTLHSNQFQQQFAHQLDRTFVESYRTILTRKRNNRFNFLDKFMIGRSFYRQLPFLIKTIKRVEIGCIVSRSCIATNANTFGQNSIYLSLNDNTMAFIKKEHITSPVRWSPVLPLASDSTATLNQHNVLPNVVSPTQSCDKETVAALSCTDKEVEDIPLNIANRLRPRLAKNAQPITQPIQDVEVSKQPKGTNSTSLVRNKRKKTTKGTNLIPEQFVHEIEDFPSSRKLKKNIDLLSPIESTKSPKKTRRTVPPSPVNRTSSFGVLWSGSDTFQKRQHMQSQRNLFNNTSSSSFVPIVPPHTLILGTHPSIQSLSKDQYYGHPMNAFWWIAGDCLGFRRDTGISNSSGEPYKLASYLRYNESYILPYEKQLEVFVSKGFALWDIIQSCTRFGSLDTDIKSEIPNDIRSFCEEFPTIRRIIVANGSTGGAFFIRYNQEWLNSGEIQPHPTHTPSQNIFGRSFKKVAKNARIKNEIDFSESDDNQGQRVIHLISAISVSPAAAMYSYEEKRDFWEKYVYQPGLQDFESSSSSPYFMPN